MWDDQKNQEGVESATREQRISGRVGVPGKECTKENKAQSDREKLVVCNQQITRKRRVPESA